MASAEDDLNSDDLLDDVDDVVEGDEAPVESAPTAAAVATATAVGGPILGDAVKEYFDWEKERSDKRVKRSAASATAKRTVFILDDRGRKSVTRFRDYFGGQQQLLSLLPKRVTDFQEEIGDSAMDQTARLQPVKEFLRYCWKQEYTGENLGNYLRIKRSTGARPNNDRLQHEQAQTFQMTADGLLALQEELGQLEAEMPAAVQAVAAAREDKDIRENAPLEAAREYQERLKSRINELTYQIAHAEVRDHRSSAEAGRARLGSRVSVVEIDERQQPLGEAREYTLVGTTEANATARRISIESPLGRGLLDQSVNDLIEIEAPSGRKRFRLLAVSG